MSERARTLLLAVSALALLAALLFGEPAIDDGYAPVTTEANVSGLAALRAWLEGEGLELQVLQASWRQLPEVAASGGATLLTHSPPRSQPDADEWAALFAWVRAGNRLVVADFGNEEFPPSRVSTMEQLAEMAPGLMLEDAARDEAAIAAEIAAGVDDIFEPRPRWVQALGALEARTLTPRVDHRLVEGVARVSVVGDLHGHRWRQLEGAGMPWIVLLEDLASGGEVAWTRAFGNGEIVVTVHPSMFANGALGRGDNALFARRVLTPADGATLFIDDGHQLPGGGDAGDRLLTDPRLHATLAAMVGLWLLWLLADDGAFARRVRPRLPVPRRRQDLVRAVGGFLSRHLAQPEAAERLLAPVRARLAMRHGVDREQALQHLVEDPAVDAVQRRQWRELLDRMRRGRRVSLIKVQRMSLEMLERLA